MPNVKLKCDATINYQGISAQAGVPFAISMPCPESPDDNKG
jgi:hypothetical protein